MIRSKHLFWGLFGLGLLASCANQPGQAPQASSQVNASPECAANARPGTFRGSFHSSSSGDSYDVVLVVQKGEGTLHVEKSRNGTLLCLDPDKMSLTAKGPANGDKFRLYTMPSRIPYEFKKESWGYQALLPLQNLDFRLLPDPVASATAK